MKEETKRWWDTAKDDLRKAKDNLGIKNYDLASFLCQQAVEKALKAVLIEKTGKFPKVHDLVKLGKLLDADKDILAKCDRLTLVYTDTRYPDAGNVKYTKKESESDIETAEVLIKWIEEKKLSKI